MLFGKALQKQKKSIDFFGSNNWIHEILWPISKLLLILCRFFKKYYYTKVVFKTFDLIEPLKFVNFPKFSATLQVQIILSLTGFDSFQQDFFVDWLVTFF